LPPSPPPLVRVRTVLLPGPAVDPPLVRVRTGAGLEPDDGATPVPAPLVRVRGAGVLTAAPEDGAREPLELVRGTLPVDATATAPVVAALAPRVPRPLGGRSWRTTWTVRRITCVRTSTAGCCARVERPVAAEPGRSV